MANVVLHSDTPRLCSPFGGHTRQHASSTSDCFYHGQAHIPFYSIFIYSIYSIPTDEYKLFLYLPVELLLCSAEAHSMRCLARAEFPQEERWKGEVELERGETVVLDNRKHSLVLKDLEAGELRS